MKLRPSSLSGYVSVQVSGVKSQVPAVIGDENLGAGQYEAILGEIVIVDSVDLQEAEGKAKSGIVASFVAAT